jgi:hypothetical protein
MVLVATNRPGFDDALPAYSTPPEIARLFRVRPTKVLSWIRGGKLAAVNLATSTAGKRPRYRVARESLQAFLAARSVVVPQRSPRRRQNDLPPVKDYLAGVPGWS